MSHTQFYTTIGYLVGMISIRIASIFAIAAFAAGSLFAPPIQQAIAAVIATDVQCTGCVGTADVAGNAITAAKIKDGEVKAAEIATDAVGAAEIQGVTKLLFGQCKLTDTEANTKVNAGDPIEIECSINGVDADDTAIATQTGFFSNTCFVVATTLTDTNTVSVFLRNDCDSTQFIGSAQIAIEVFDKQHAIVRKVIRLKLSAWDGNFDPKGTESKNYLPYCGKVFDYVEFDFSFYVKPDTSCEFIQREKLTINFQSPLPNKRIQN